MPYIIGVFLMGCAIGSVFGLFVCCLCVTAKQADERGQKMIDDNNEILYGKEPRNDR